MIAVLFQVIPTLSKRDRYFSLAKQLHADLEKIDGFISIERFQSTSTPNSYLSLSFWQNEHAVMQWKQDTAHQIAQQQGKANLFAYYRVRVATVFRDYEMDCRTEGSAFQILN